jgi:hypothetical protein
MTKKILLWLDDYRDPFDRNIDWLVFSPIGRNIYIVWVKSFEQFCNYINKSGLPDGICFDHDLGENELGEEQSGYDCAKWLVDYCLDNDLILPKYNIQSANPVGKENIDKLFKSFLKFKGE